MCPQEGYWLLFVALFPFYWLEFEKPKSTAQALFTNGKISSLILVDLSVLQQKIC